MESRDIHGYQRGVDQELAAISRNRDIAPEDKEMILLYYRSLVAQGLGAGRVLCTLWDLKKVCTCWLPHAVHLSTATVDDVRSVVACIEASHHGPTVKRGLIRTLRLLYVWLGRETLAKSLPLQPTPRRVPRCSEQMLTAQEVDCLIRAAQNPRDKAFVAVLYESGCRIGEVLGLQLRHVTFDDHGASLLVHGKTGSRRIRIVAAVPYLAECIRAHRAPYDPHAWLWCGRDTAGLGYLAARYLLVRLARRTGVRKPVNPHNFRHSRASHLAQHLTESQMQEFFGWTRASTMAAVYVHLSARDVDRAILRLHGIDPDSNSSPTQAAVN